MARKEDLCFISDAYGRGQSVPVESPVEMHDRHLQVVNYTGNYATSHLGFGLRKGI